MDIINKISLFLTKKVFAVLALLVTFYVLFRLPDALVIGSHTALIFPLGSLYHTRLLFDGLSVNPSLAGTLITPANSALIYPPGIYFINLIVGSVGGIFWALLVFQVSVGPLIYLLIRRVLPPLGAILLALLGTYYFTNVNWWAPDFIIQPLMLCGCLLVVSRGFRRGLPAYVFTVGQLVGLIIIFKHNIGTFFGILCGALLFLDSFQKPTANRHPGHLRFTLTLLAPCLLFGLIFYQRLLHLDETVFYILPYTLFWATFFSFIYKTGLIFNFARFARIILILFSSAIILPLGCFIYFGTVIGYERYFHSLFGMGFDFLPIWSYGIFNIIGAHVQWNGLKESYKSLVMLCFFSVPLLVNISNIIFIRLDLSRRPSCVTRHFTTFRTTAVGVMGAFMLFPLEGYHILQTKLFLFVFVLAWSVRRNLKGALVPFGYFLAVMLLPVIAAAVVKASSTPLPNSVFGSPAMQDFIGLPLRPEVAKELERQLSVIRRSVSGAPYYIIDSSGGTLIGLAVLEDNILPQYYIEMRRGMLTKEIVEAVTRDLDNRPFVIVNERDFVNRGDIGFDPLLAEIITYIDDHYSEVDAYITPEPKSPFSPQLMSFLVFRRDG